MVGAVTSGFATCAAGEKIVGGSVNISNVPDGAQTMEVLASRPSVNDVGTGTVPSSGQAYAFWKGTGTLTNLAAAGASCDASSTYVDEPRRRRDARLRDLRARTSLGPELLDGPAALGRRRPFRTP